MDGSEKSSKRNKKNKKLKTGDKVLITLIVILALLLILVTVCFALVNHYLNMINKVDPNGPEDIIPPASEDFETDFSDDDYPDQGGTPGPGETLAPGETRDPNVTADPDIVTDTMPPEEHWGDITWPEDPTPTDHESSDLINILIVGQDRRPGESRQRSDSMMVVSINVNKKEVSVISFLRDLYVQIPGYSDNRLNVAYKFGGFPLLKEALFKNFGVTIDGCFECNFDTFTEIIDYFGGVKINVTEKEARYMQKYMGVNVSAGTQKLSGKEALCYSRIRKIDSDFQRTNRQYNVLMSIFNNNIKSASLVQLNDIANTLLPKLTTDMTNSQIMNLMTKVLPILGSLNDNTIHRYQVPYEGAYRSATIRKMAVLVPDLQAIRNKIANEMLPK